MNKVSEEYFTRVYDYSYQEVFSVIYSYVKTKYDAEDILQDTFMSFLDKNPSFKSLEETKYWLIRVSINKSINFLKKKSKTTTLADDFDVKVEDESNDESTLIFNKLTSLPEKLKIVMILYYYNNMKIKDIAKTLKISESAVKMRLERGKEQLKKELGGLI